MEPTPQPTPPQNPYDFITNPEQPSKGPAFGGSLKSRILIVAGGLILLIIIFSVVSTILSSAGRSANQALKSIVAQQQEIVRIADLGAKEATSIDARTFATTTQLAVSTSQQQLSARLDELGLTVTKLEAGQKKDSKIDAALEAAAANNKYDEVLEESLITKLEAYLKDLKTSYDKTESQKTKDVLTAAYTSAATLLEPTKETE